MGDISAKADLKTDIEVRPSGSQTVLVAGMVAVIVFALCGTWLIGSGNIGGWGVVGLAGIGFVGCLWSWRHSQSDMDLAGAHATHISLPDGSNLATDSRLLRSPDSVKAVLQVVDQLLCRQPLPPAKALLDDSLGIISGSEQDALIEVQRINVNTQAISNDIVSAINALPDGKSVTQIPTHQLHAGPVEGQQ